MSHPLETPTQEQVRRIAIARGATPQQADDIAADVAANRSAGSFFAGINEDVIFGSDTRTADTPEAQKAARQAQRASQAPLRTSAQTEASIKRRTAAANIRPAPVAATRGADKDVDGRGRGGGGGDQDPLIELLNRFADTQDELRKIAASQVQLEQAFRDSQVALQAAQEGRLTTESLSQPGTNLFATFGQFRRAGEPIPLPPDIAALVQGKEIPGGGNIPGTGIQTVPNNANLQQLFRDALSKASSRTLQNIGSATTERLQTFGTLAGLDPLSAFEDRQRQIPRASRVSGALFANS